MEPYCKVQKTGPKSTEDHWAKQRETLLGSIAEVV